MISYLRLQFRELVCTLVLMVGSLCFSPLLLAASSDLLFDAGNRAYLDGHYEEALDKWLEIEQQNFEGGELFYNLGNAYFKLGKIGHAILYWERAAKFLGEDDDIKANLLIARSRLADKIDDQVRLPVWNWFDSVRSQLTTTLLTLTSAIFCFLIFFLISLNRWVVKNTGLKNWLKRLVWVMMFLFVVDLSLVILRARDDYSNIHGVLLVRESEVLSAPAEGTGKLLFTLHEGAKVTVTRQLKSWSEISVGKDKRGWVKNNHLGII